jgi:hypothetical protein
MGRDENSGSTGQIRSIDTLTPSEKDFDQDAWLIRDGRDSKLSHLGFIYPFMSSHVLLAACQPQEKAFEGPCQLNLKTREVVRESIHRGVFTSHLVSNLYRAISNGQSTTYVTLLDDLSTELLSSGWYKTQHPACEGINNKRYLFSTTSDEPMFKLTKDESLGGTTFKADAGWIHGAVKGTEFIVHPNRGTLVADAVRSDSCNLVFKPGPKFHIPRDGRALMSVGKSLKVYLGTHVGNLDVRDRFTIVTERAEAHVTVQFISGSTRILRFESVDHERLLQHSKPSGQVLTQDLVSLLDKIAFFNFHLHRARAYPLQDKHGYPKDSKSSGLFSRALAPIIAVFRRMPHHEHGHRLLDECSCPLYDKHGSPLLDERVRIQYNENERPLHSQIKLKLVPLDDRRGLRVPIDDEARNLDEDRPTSVNIPASPMYGLTLENRSEYKLFPYLFYFRPLDCTISVRHTYPVHLDWLKEICSAILYPGSI